MPKTQAKQAATQALAVAQAQQAVVQATQEKDAFRKLLEEKLPQLAEASLAKYPPEFIVSTVMTLLRHTPKLRECRPQTVLSGVLNSLQLGLNLNPVLGEAWLIPRKNHGVLEANFQPGYRGVLKYMLRNPIVADIFASAVRDKDEFSMSHGRVEDLIHKVDPRKSEKQRGDIVGFYVHCHFRSGGYVFVYWNKVDMDAFAVEFRSDDRSDSTWNEFYEDMALKTMLIQIRKFIPGEDRELGEIIQYEQKQADEPVVDPRDPKTTDMFTGATPAKEKEIVPATLYEEMCGKALSVSDEAAAVGLFATAQNLHAAGKLTLTMANDVQFKLQVRFPNLKKMLKVGEKPVEQEKRETKVKAEGKPDPGKEIVERSKLLLGQYKKRLLAITNLAALYNVKATADNDLKSGKLTQVDYDTVAKETNDKFLKLKAAASKTGMNN